MKRAVFIIILLCCDCWGMCPSGFFEINRPNIVIADVCPFGMVSLGVVKGCDSNVTGTCWIFEKLRTLCGAGITKLNTSGGLSIPLYSDKSTSPSIHIKYNNTVCYADLEQGTTTGTIHVKYKDVVYRAVGE